MTLANGHPSRAYSLFFSLVDSLFLPCIPCWIFRLKEDTVLSGNQTQHKLTEAHVVFLSRHRRHASVTGSV